jgi:peptide-methionine (R)-S-oxide reductase
MKDDETLKKEYPELYRVAREGGTERPGSSPLLSASEDGVFHCAVCNAPLFTGEKKFDSGTGWPSFTEPINKEAIKYVEDTDYGMHRTEVRCAKCDAHLGHVFPDGPEKSGGDSADSGRHDRYCINGVCLNQLDS